MVRRRPRAFDCYRRHICPNNTPNIISQMPIARARFIGIQFWKSAASVIYFQPRFSTLDPLTHEMSQITIMGLTSLDDCLWCCFSSKYVFASRNRGRKCDAFLIGAPAQSSYIDPLLAADYGRERPHALRKKVTWLCLLILMLVGALHLFSCRVTSFTSRSKPAGASMRSRQIECAQAKMRKPLSRSLFNTTQQTHAFVHARRQVDPEMKWECARLHKYLLCCLLMLLLRDVTFVWYGRAPGEANYY
jgi:hypothetical protein